MIPSFTERRGMKPPTLSEYMLTENENQRIRDFADHAREHLESRFSHPDFYSGGVWDPYVGRWHTEELPDVLGPEGFIANHAKEFEVSRGRLTHIDWVSEGWSQSAKDQFTRAKKRELPISLGENETLRLEEYHSFRYEVLKQLGEGGFGTVYLARDFLTDKMVVLKFIHLQDDPDDYFEDEIQPELVLKELLAIKYLTGSDVDLSFIPSELEGMQTLVLQQEYIAGVELANVSLLVEEALASLMDIMEEVHRVHKGGYVHKDLKWGNVMLTTDGRSRLIDWGLLVRTGMNPSEDDTERKQLEQTFDVLEKLPLWEDFISCMKGLKKENLRQYEQFFSGKEDDPLNDENLRAMRQVYTEMQAKHVQEREAYASWGTPDYMAEEAYHGVTTHQSDIYSLGVMLATKLLGDVPGNQDDVVINIDALLFLSDYSEEKKRKVADMLTDIIAHARAPISDSSALASDAITRYKTVPEMMLDIQNVILLLSEKE